MDFHGGRPLYKRSGLITAMALAMAVAQSCVRLTATAASDAYGQTLSDNNMELEWELAVKIREEWSMYNGDAFMRTPGAALAPRHPRPSQGLGQIHLTKK